MLLAVTSFVSAHAPAGNAGAAAAATEEQEDDEDGAGGWHCLHLRVLVFVEWMWSAFIEVELQLSLILIRGLVRWCVLLESVFVEISTRSVLVVLDLKLFEFLAIFSIHVALSFV